MVFVGLRRDDVMWVEESPLCMEVCGDYNTVLGSSPVEWRLRDVTCHGNVDFFFFFLRNGTN